MATIDTSRTYGSYGLVGRISASISAIAAMAIEWNDARVTRNALSGLTDRELDDIGMVRGDIDRVAQHNRIF